MPPDAATPWAKLERDPDSREVLAALPLLDHCLDVGAAMGALLAGGAWDRALEAAAGRAPTGRDRARLVALATLHDFGKANRGFQARWDHKAERVGHEGQVAALLRDPGLRATAAGEALRALVAEWGAGPYLPALMAHHGRPRTEFGPTQAGDEPWKDHVRFWRPGNGYDPVAEVARLIDQVRIRWPDAWQPGDELPQAPRFVALFAGLVTLADWLGSDVNRFPIAGPHGPERDPLRLEQAARVVAAEGLAALPTPSTDFAAAFELSGPRGVQREATADDLGPIALIEAETGSGKTEAALWRWLDLRRRGEVDGLYFALPTRSAAKQLHKRVDDMLRRVWGGDGPRAVLALPAYLRVGDVEGEALPGWEVGWDDDRRDGRWAAERSNRFLSARVAVGTIDQALRGALRAKHAFVRASALARSLLVVDEVHASDAYMGELLQRLLHNHVATGGRALLLSATLGAEARARLLGHEPQSLAEAEAQPYPALSGSEAPPRRASSDDARVKRVSIETAGLIDDSEAIAKRAVEAARGGASVLVVRNSVSGAVRVARAIEALDSDVAFRVNGTATLHHGRFAPSDRHLLDDAVGVAFGKGRTAEGRVLVGTQTLEQSLDIDADLLITDLAPMDVLLQRIGRLHRHARDDRGAFDEARVVVLRPAKRDLASLLDTRSERHGMSERHGLGPLRDGRGVYPNLIQMEATLRLLEAKAVVTIPADNRSLVERALHSDMLSGIADGLGTAWINHLNDCAGAFFADGGMARDSSLDLGTRFRDLFFADASEKVAARLGEQNLLVDFREVLDGPFGEPVARVSIPHWMARGIGPEDKPEALGGHEDGEAFRLGGRRYVYGRWGLAPLA